MALIKSLIALINRFSKKYKKKDQIKFELIETTVKVMSIKLPPSSGDMMGISPVKF